MFYVYFLYFVFLWYFYLVFGQLYQEKSGNPAPDDISSNREKRETLQISRRARFFFKSHCAEAITARSDEVST
jgi:hypothetical protein